MLNLENERNRLAELEAEYERKKDVYGGQMILGQVIELRRIVAVLEKAEVRANEMRANWMSSIGKV